MESRFPVPVNVMQILRRSCYDCHSDSTVYPWYAEIQPVGWWLNSHIEDGKRGINFNRFGSYRLMRQYLERCGVRVSNATAGGLLDVFPRMSLEAALAESD